MPTKKVVIYCRYSTDMQRPDSCADQERAVRAALARLGVAAEHAVVISDEAESGTKADRDGFRRLQAMVARGEVAVIAVDDQSRLSRAENAFAFIQDLAFTGGRFIATGEGIDTVEPGWELKVQVLQLHHGQTVRDLRHRVRRGQRGRVDADGSAGDFPYGYESYYLDPEWEQQLRRRGPKPKKGLRICEKEAKWVRRVFAWFVAGRSIGWIARKLTRRGVPKGRRATTHGWHPQQVRRLLTNEKYIGRWRWGSTTTKTNSAGRKKQVAAAAAEVVMRERPALRIIAQDVWEQAQARFEEFQKRFGLKEGQAPRGPKPPAGAAAEYPRSPLGGLLRCGTCGAALWQHHSNARRYYACPSHKKGACASAAQVPAEPAERAVAGLLAEMLMAWPEWLRRQYELTAAAVAEAAAGAGERRGQDARRLALVEGQIRNLVGALADGQLDSPAVRERLVGAEREAAELRARLAAPVVSAVGLPDEAWVKERLAKWAFGLADGGPEAARLLRAAVASVTATAVVAAGKKRGFARLTVRVNAAGALLAALGGKLPAGAAEALAAGGSEPPAFVLDLGGPTQLDHWGPQIARWRAEGVPWKEIAARTGLDLNRAWIAGRRYGAPSAGGP
jgi:site-specific DNA recombinase